MWALSLPLMFYNRARLVLVVGWVAGMGQRKEKKNFASSKKLFTSFKEKWPLGKKSPFTRNEKGVQ